MSTITETKITTEKITTDDLSNDTIVEKTETTEKVENPSKSGLRTKVFSLLLLALLIVPAILISPVRDNSAVLGVSENLEMQPQIGGQIINNPAPNSQKPKSAENFDLNNLFATDSAKAKTAKIGEIGSGAQEIRNVDKDEAKSITGKVIWDENARTGIATDKFPLGSSIKVNYNKKDVFLVVGDTRVLASDTVLVVNREAFVKLGGNPDKENKITVTVSLDN